MTRRTSARERLRAHFGSHYDIEPVLRIVRRIVREELALAGAKCSALADEHRKAAAEMQRRGVNSIARITSAVACDDCRAAITQRTKGVKG